MTNLFEPAAAGKLTLGNRIVMAPLTRNRAHGDGVPQDIAATYYSQRSSAGLIITEGTQPSAVGQGYANTPGIHNDEQIGGWRAVAEAVHDSGGQIVVQLMHTGRIGHPDNKHGLEVVAPSAVAAPDAIFTPTGMQPYPIPRALETDELAGIIGEFVQASKNAIDAGLDGVELHSANGYLLHQFLAPSSNVRTDTYGGSPQARAGFVVEVAEAVARAIGPERVGIRISPSHNIQGVLETDEAETAATYRALIDGIAPLGLAYLHALADPRSELIRDLRARFGGVFIANDGFATVTTKEHAQQILDEGLADLVAVGRLFLANPDLPRRWRFDAELNEPDAETFYTPGPRGYIDYPALAE
jgi:2,4-dienoyl-CoA reductase-like NADH-dependent reductase (Old Yellow Enzyme family)